ncbi:hypothetical protein HOA55_02045 [archaeon]|mgnify:CR=1 FL=1|nr:hypothetical protein [archaeon]MBT7025394.1 hypothetical protein [archaeon]MBT7568165.1 hypothetical protein [archaeon]
MGKNSQIHIYLETKLRRKLEREAEARCISVSELCRQKLRDGDKLDRILEILEKG